MFKHPEPKTRFIITAAVFAVAITLFGFAVLYYAIPAIVQESGTIEQTKTNLAALEEQKTVLLAEEEKIKTLSAPLDAVASAIVPANNPIAFFGILEQVASHERLSLEINPAPPAQNSPQNTLGLTVSVEGAMRQEIDFAETIATLPFIITVSDITFSRDVSAESAQTSSIGKPVTPTVGKTTLTMTLFAASRP